MPSGTTETEKTRLPASKRGVAWMHWLRVAGVVSLAFLIPSAQSTEQVDVTLAPTLEQLPSQLPWTVERIDPTANSAGFWELKNTSGSTVGYATRTLPQAATVVGYRGPTEAVLVVDSKLTIVAAGLLGSSDTKEHVQEVRDNVPFFAQFVGWQWSRPNALSDLDAVSGATLTSLALAEGILARMGVSAGSLIFSEPLQVQDIQDWFPEASIIDGGPARFLVKDSSGSKLGEVLRTGPLADDIIGYQGPSELLIQVSSDTVKRIRLLNTFDNEPYVDWIRQEKYYWNRFTEKSTSSIGQIDLEAEGIEGISGATMSSMAMTETLVQSMQRLATSDEPSDTKSANLLGSIRWFTSDAVTLGLLIVLWGLHQTHAFRRRWLRRTWLIAVFALLGLYTHNLLSLALLAGWSAEGIAWRLAPGLTALAAVSILIPPFRKANPYCNHLCPHGAFQQWIRPNPGSRRRIHLNRNVFRTLRFVPGALLVAAYISMVVQPNSDLSGWEPFHAYVLQIATLGSIVFSLLTLAVSAAVPMAYCQFGCPTGFLIDHLRLRGDSRQWRRADVVMVALLAFALAAYAYRSW